MRKIYFFGLGILLICLAGWGIHCVYRPHQNVENERASATMTASSLYNEFLNSETGANQKWVGKVVKISGRISSLSESGNYISINLSASKEGGVDCSVLKKDMPTATLLNKGDSITIKGRCTGFLMDVNLVDCIVKK